MSRDFDSALMDNLLIQVQPQVTICAALSRVFPAWAGADGTDDFGAAENVPDMTSRLLLSRFQDRVYRQIVQ
jgi:hypothetical protein